MIVIFAAPRIGRNKPAVAGEYGTKGGASGALELTTLSPVLSMISDFPQERA
jgi:hypothetical protein